MNRLNYRMSTWIQGDRLSYSCTYPSLGEDCFMEYRCSSDLYDFVSGCKDTSTTGYYSGM